MGRVLDIVPNHMGFAHRQPVLARRPGERPAGAVGDVLRHRLEPGQGLARRPRAPADPRRPVRQGARSGPAHARARRRRASGSATTTAACRCGRGRTRRSSTAAPTSSRARFDADDDDVLEYLSIRDAARRLPVVPVLQARGGRAGPPREGGHQAAAPAALRPRAPAPRLPRRERRLVPGARPATRAASTALHELLEDQVYRLAYWRVAAEEINYRRFFDVTELAGIRVEDELVFEHVHRLIFRWVREGGVTGLRVDHPDGLADPLELLPPAPGAPLPASPAATGSRPRAATTPTGRDVAGLLREPLPRARSPPNPASPAGPAVPDRRREDPQHAARSSPPTGRSTARSATST